MAITQASDFTGKWQIATDQYSTNRIQPYIDKYEPIYLAKLLGAVLSDDLITDIGGGTSPTDPLLVLIFNPFTKDGSCGELHISEGIKAFLRGAIYWHFMTDGKVSPNPVSGSSKPKTENSNTAVGMAYINSRYNDAVDTAKAIQWFICENSADYPDYNGQEFLYQTLL